MRESDIILERGSYWLGRKGKRLTLFMLNGSHSVKVGDVRSIEHAERLIERLERYPEKAKAFIAG